VYTFSFFKRRMNIDISNDSIPPKYTTFHHLVYVARWSLTLIYFKKIKKTQKLVGDHLAT